MQTDFINESPAGRTVGCPGLESSQAPETCSQSKVSWSPQALTTATRSDVLQPVLSTSFQAAQAGPRVCLLPIEPCEARAAIRFPIHHPHTDDPFTIALRARRIQH